MAARTFDCIVIGSGPGGYVAAIRAAQLGHDDRGDRAGQGRRALPELRLHPRQGGPARRRHAHRGARGRETSGSEGRPAPRSTTRPSMARREKVVSTLTGGVAGLFKKNRIELIEGEATLTAEGTVSVGDDELIAAKTIVLATGSVPRADPRRRVRRARDRHRGGLGARRAAARARRRRRRRLGRGDRLRRTRVSAREVLLFEVLDRVLPTEDADISKARRARPQAPGHRRSTRARSSRTSQTGGVQRHLRFGEPARGRLARDRRRPRRPTSKGSGSTAAGVELDERGLIEVDGAHAHQRATASTRSATSSPARRSRTRPPTRASSPPRTPPGCRRIRSPTSTSRARPSARRTSAPSA